MKRRYFACTALKKDVTEYISKTKIDRYLFGEKLAETLKSARAVSKSSSEIKVQQNRYRKSATTQSQPSTSKNWKSAPTNRRPSGPQRGRLAGPPPPPPPSAMMMAAAMARSVIAAVTLRPSRISRGRPTASRRGKICWTAGAFH